MCIDWIVAFWPWVLNGRREVGVTEDFYNRGGGLFLLKKVMGVGIESRGGGKMGGGSLQGTCRS